MALLGPVAAVPSGIAGNPSPFHLASHGLSAGDGPLTVTTTGTRPAPLAGATPYYAVPAGANDLELADSRAHALAGATLRITTRGVGVHTLVTAAALHASGLTFAQTFTVGASGAVTPIYGDVGAADVSTYLQTLAASSGYAPVAGWNFDVAGTTATDFCAGAIDLVQAGGAGTVASTHGRAAPQTAAGALWQVADETKLNYGTVAVAYLFRFKLPAAPSGTVVLIGKGSTASPHIVGQISAAGFLSVHAKQSGGPTTVEGTLNVADNAWHWGIVGRSLTDQLVRATVIGTGGDVSAAFANTIDISNATPGQAFALGPPSGGQMDCQYDHALVFTVADAENLLTNRVAILTALEAAELPSVEQFVTFGGAHGLSDGDGPLQITTSGARPGGTSLLTDYYAIATGHGATAAGLATSYANAIANTAITITSAGTPANTLTATGAALHWTPVALGNSTFTTID